VPKVTIYLPDDLHEWTQSKEGLNVSALCQQALRAEQAKDLPVSDDTDTEAIVARLRASKDKQTQWIYQEGRKWGRSWAAKNADWDTLSRMANNRENWEPVRDSAIYEMFVESAIEAQREDSPWDWDITLAGFRAGALEIWDQVKGKL
jgi:hypothetical protein